MSIKDGAIQEDEYFDSRATTFHTLGYEQSAPEDFIRRLQQHRVAKVVDVRADPVSRKPGFSKHQLKALLAAAGIDYVHVQTLGAPKELRAELRSSGSWWSYIKAYNARVLSRSIEEVDFLIRLAARERISLLCFERDPDQCHRSLIACAMIERSNGRKLRVEHIRY